MTEPWWLTPNAAPPPGTGPDPALVAGRRVDLMRAVRARRLAFTPDWLDPPDTDAGGALVQLYAGMVAALAQRVNGTADRPGLVEKARREFFSAAGVRPEPATVAETVLQFTVAPTAGRSVRVPAKFQAAAGGSARVVFETEAELDATPLVVEVLRSAGRGGDRVPFELKDQVVKAPDGAEVFGSSPRLGDALEIGFGGPPAAPDRPPTIALGFELAPAGDGPAPVAGGEPDPAGPVLRWLAVGSPGAEATVVSDGTRGLTRSGVVVLRPPVGWAAVKDESAGVPLEKAPVRYQLRVEVVSGRFPRPVVVRAVRTNAVAARAVRTVRNETVAVGDDRRGKLRVAPVVGGSVRLLVSRPALSEAELSRLPADPTVDGPAADVWTEVASLGGAGPADRVFTLDPRTGELEFGDGRNGAAVPAGVRVLAAAYETGGGPAGAVAAGAVNQLVSAAPFVVKVTNPRRATGGAAAETSAAAADRGAQLLRSRGRAVGGPDYEARARSAPGADVRRAKAVAYRDPSAPGRPAPGVVGVWVVSSRPLAGPPVPDPDTLRAVADYLAGRVAPPGVRVVAAAPRFRRVRVELRFQADAAADPGKVAGDLLDALDAYFDPLAGGPDGTGWPFGAAVRYDPLVRRLFAAVPDVRGVTAVRVVLDGEPFAGCADAPIGETDLLWPAGHEVRPDDSGGRP